MSMPIDSKPAPWKSSEAVELATLEWVFRFNHHRLLESIGYVPPAEAEANYYRKLSESIAAAAWLKPSSLHETRGGSHRLGQGLGLACLSAEEGHLARLGPVGVLQAVAAQVAGATG